MPAVRRRSAKIKLRAAPARRVSSGRGAPAGAKHVEGRVLGLEAGSDAVFAETDGTRYSVRVPRHVDRRWLAAATAIAPVPAVVLHPPGLSAPVLWCVFAESAHETLDERFEIRAKEIDLVGTRTVRLRAGQSLVTVSANGEVHVVGRNITSRASNVNRVRGGAVHLN